MTIYVTVFLNLDYSSVYDISMDPYIWVHHVQAFSTEKKAKAAADLWIRAGAQHPEKPNRTIGDSTDAYVQAVEVEE